MLACLQEGLSLPDRPAPNLARDSHEVLTPEVLATSTV
jgi:hypothetical protein